MTSGLMYNVGSVTQRSMPFWPLLTCLGDMFGQPVLKPRTPIDVARLLREAGKSGLIELTGAHDDDLVPWDPANPEDDLNEGGEVLQQLLEIKGILDEGNVGFHTMTCNLHAHPLFQHGGLANPDPTILALAWRKVERTIRIGHFLGARMFTYWVARDGFVVATKMNWTKVYHQIAAGLNHARGYIRQNKLDNYLNYVGGTIEPKPNEPTGHSFLPTAGHAAGFITSGLLEDPVWWGVNPELLQHEGMALLDPITTIGYLVSIGKLSFLHLGNQIRGHEDNDFPPLVGPEGLKETAHMFWLLNDLGWKGVVEFDCHMLREDAEPSQPLQCLKSFIADCSTGLATALLLAERLAEAAKMYQSQNATRADISSVIHMCGLTPDEVLHWTIHRT